MHPGEIDSSLCFTSVSGSPITEASFTTTYTIQFVDLWSNEHYYTLTDELNAGMVVTVVGDYVHHNNYLSPIDIPDLTDW